MTNNEREVMHAIQDLRTMLEQAVRAAAEAKTAAIEDRAMMIATLEQLRGKGLLTDEDVQDITNRMHQIATQSAPPSVTN